MFKLWDKRCRRRFLFHLLVVGKSVAVGTFSSTCFFKNSLKKLPQALFLVTFCKNAQNIIKLNKQMTKMTKNELQG